MARASAIPPSPGAPRTPSSTTGPADRATPSSVAGGSRAAAIRRAARAAMAARCGAVSSSRAASSSDSSKRSAVSPSGVTSVHLNLPETTETCPARTMLPRPPARVLAGTSRTCSASTTSSASAADWSVGQTGDGRHQDASPGDVSRRRPRLCTLLGRLERPGQIAAGRERRAQDEDERARQRPQAAGGGRAGPLNHGVDAVKTQLATSPTNRSTPKIIT